MVQQNVLLYKISKYNLRLQVLRKECLVNHVYFQQKDGADMRIITFHRAKKTHMLQKVKRLTITVVLVHN